MKSLFLRAGRLWCAGAVLLLLRLSQNHGGFDPATGLALPSASGIAALVLLALCAAGELALFFRMPKEKIKYAVQFAAPEKELPAVVLGSLLLAAGGVLLLVQGFRLGQTAAEAAGLLALAAGAGILTLNRRARTGEELSVMPVLPVMFFAVFFVLAVYSPMENDPVFARYYLPILTSAMVAYSFAQLAGFLRGESSLRTFVFAGDMTVILCLMSLADGNPAKMLLFAGCALIFSVYLLLWREPEKGESIGAA